MTGVTTNDARTDDVTQVRNATGSDGGSGGHERPAAGDRTPAGPGATGLTVAVHPVSAPESAALLRRYCTELIVRYYDRPTTDEEVTATLAEMPSDHLARPTGEFLIAHRDGVPVGCIGLRVIDAHTVEMARMYVGPEARGQGVAALLIAALERVARDDFGAAVIRLDTRKDLVEARGLYAKHGYTETAPYNDNWLADHWFEKKLHRPG